MASVYVAGPVVRGGEELPRWVEATYEQAYQVIGLFHAEAVMPHSERQLENMAPEVFYSEIERRISSADTAIVIFTGEDVSAGIEATMASLKGKKVMIVSDKLAHVPRLLGALPNLVNTVEFSDKQAVFSAVTAFLQETLRGRARGITASH
jgi:nucleoside 2-deoxyribosyltransferase